jgi:hypothetical protein
MQTDPDPQKLWQSQQTEHVPMNLAEIHEKSRAFQTRIKRRNLIEYAACVVVVLAFLWEAVSPVNWMMRTGSALLIVATIFVAWQLHRRGSAERTPEIAGALADFYRAQLVRQRDAARSVVAWYIAPFVPGMTLLLTGVWFVRGSNHALDLFTGALTVVVFAWAWWRNQRGAKRLQQRIDELQPPRS